MSAFLKVHYKAILGGALLAATLLIVPTPARAEMAQNNGGTPVLYVTGSAKSIVSLRAHVRAGDIVAPQSYAATKAGQLLGKVSPEIISITQNANAKLMPLVVNQNFSQSGVHAFLVNERAQDKLIAALVNEAKEKNYAGFQYDFEHMLASDKDRYSAFIKRSAPRFHEAGLEFSVAVAPKHSDLASAYGKGSWQNWTGVFDYRAIGEAADFVSVMAYDDSKSVGPVAALPWVKDVLAYSLERIPAEKISLGVPFYAWSMNTATGKRDHVTTYPKVVSVLKSKTIKRGWSEKHATSYVTYYSGNKKLTTWYEDRRSFAAKFALVEMHDLHGFSAWALGQEDPGVWDVIHSPSRDLAFGGE